MVFLFDVDNTLLDNDRVTQDISAFLNREVGRRRANQYWRIFQKLRMHLGYADYLGALQRYRCEEAGAGSFDPGLSSIASFLLDYPFAERVYPAALDALSQVRNAVSGIRSTALSAELVSATALLEAQGVKVKCETEHVKLPHDRETALALSLREAATNIRRHSGATGVTIRVKQEPTAVIVEVTDDGRGGRIVPGNGLNGMRERLDSVGGSLSLTPNKDGGVLLRASVPVAA